MRLRKVVERIKKKHGFKCKFPNCSCCTRTLHFNPEDYIFMKEKNLDVSGLDVHFNKKGDVLYISNETKLKKIKNNDGRIREDWGCYYEILDENEGRCGCSLHPNNPLLCHTFPIVLNFEDEIIIEKAGHCRQKTKMRLSKKERRKLLKLMSKYKRDFSY